MTAGRRYGIATCVIVRSLTVLNELAVRLGGNAPCLVCGAQGSPPTAIAVVEVAARNRCLTASLCASCAQRPDRELIAAAYANLRVLLPSLRPLGPGGSA
jgi:hypothetical protein